MLSTSTVAEVVSRLDEVGLIRAVPDSAVAVAKQQEMLERLLGRRCSDNGQAFTAAYDSMMRLAELALAERGYEFGDMPHRALKDLATGLDSGFRVDDIVKIRHDVKKMGITPSQAHVDQLLASRARLASLVGLEHLL